jgi:predicted GTPase
MNQQAAKTKLKPHVDAAKMASAEVKANANERRAAETHMTKHYAVAAATKQASHKKVHSFVKSLVHGLTGGSPMMGDIAHHLTKAVLDRG